MPWKLGNGASDPRMKFPCLNSLLIISNKVVLRLVTTVVCAMIIIDAYSSHAPTITNLPNWNEAYLAKKDKGELVESLEGAYPDLAIRDKTSFDWIALCEFMGPSCFVMGSHATK